MSMRVIHEYRTVDKSTWGDGPWQSEPDKVQWVEEGTGLAALAVRHPDAGHWCGYVGVTEGHTYFGVGYSECREGCQDYCDWELGHTPGNALSVHGGLTFASFCQEDAEETGVCHIAEAGQPERVWWLGFDFAHLDDLSPGSAARTRALGLRPIGQDIYRDLAYVADQCAVLAIQLGGVK